MSRIKSQDRPTVADQAPGELIELKERLQSQPPKVRAELEPLIEDALENARFRGRAMRLAREALERFRLDLAMMEFDLEATRREREAYRRRLERF